MTSQQSGGLKLSIYDNEHLPLISTENVGIKDILLAINPEIIQLREDISQLKKELYVKTTEYFINRWEADFSLKFDGSLTLDQRRQRILNKLARKKTLTWKNLELLIKNNIDNPQIYIINNSGEYHFRIIVQTQNIENMRNAVKQAKPAYLTFDILVTEYSNRCGTFNSGTNPI